MKDRVHSLFPAIVLGLLAGASIWLDRITQQDQTLPQDNSRHEPDFIVEQVKLRRYDVTGKTQYVLVADKMTHFADDESSDLTRPRLDYLNRPEPMHLESDRALVSKEGEKVLMSGNVFARRAATPDKPESTLRSDRMTVWPNDEKMLTDTPVTLTQGQTVVTAERMDADNIAGELHLHGQVRGTFYRKQASKP